MIYTPVRITPNKILSIRDGSGGRQPPMPLHSTETVLHSDHIRDGINVPINIFLSPTQ